MMSEESKQLYVFKVDERNLCTTGTAIFAADTKEEARSMFYGLKYKDLRRNSETEDLNDVDNETFVDNKYTKVLFHRPERINRFLNTTWYLEYEFFLKVSVKKGLKSISYSD